MTWWNWYCYDCRWKGVAQELAEDFMITIEEEFSELDREDKIAELRQIGAFDDDYLVDEVKMGAEPYNLYSHPSLGHVTSDLMWENLGGTLKPVGINPEYEIETPTPPSNGGTESGESQQQFHRALPPPSQRDRKSVV